MTIPNGQQLLQGVLVNVALKMAAPLTAMAMAMAAPTSVAMANGHGAKTSKAAATVPAYEDLGVTMERIAKDYSARGPAATAVLAQARLDQERLMRLVSPSPAARITMLHLDEANSEILVGLAGDMAAVDALATLAQQGGPTRLRFALTEAMAAVDYATVEASNPLMAGSAITHDGYGCTAGFTVRNTNSGQNYLLTAGHCSPNNGIIETFVSPGGLFEGYGGSSTFINGGTANGDIAVISNGSGTAYKPWIYTSTARVAPDTELAVISGADYSGIRANVEYAARGVRSGYSRGWKLTPGASAYSFFWWYNGIRYTTWITNVAYVYQTGTCGTYCTVGLGNGDSGGPLYNGTTAAGMTAGGIFSGFPSSTCSYSSADGRDFAGCRGAWFTSFDTVRSIWPNISVLTG